MYMAKSLACKRLLSARGFFNIKRFKEGEISITCNLEFDQNLNTRMRKVWLKMFYFQLFNKTPSPPVSDQALGPSEGLSETRIVFFFCGEEGWKFAMIQTDFLLLVCSLKYFTDTSPIFKVQNIPKNAFLRPDLSPPPPDTQLWVLLEIKQMPRAL